LNWPGLTINGNIGGKVYTGSQAGVDFEAGFKEIRRASQVLKTGNVQGASVVNVNADELRNEITKHDGFTVFNVRGEEVYVGNFDYTSTCDSGKNFVFNFFEAKKIKLEHMKICGIILAPDAYVHGFSGLLEGKLYCTEWRDDSNYQINDRIVDICIPDTSSTSYELQGDKNHGQTLEATDDNGASASARVSVLTVFAIVACAFVI
jgi:choice-of-anchor A domain-containing protein